jgi:hypothetical protein
MWLNIDWREKLVKQMVLRKMKHFTHGTLFPVTFTMFEIIKQRGVNASEMHLRHSCPKLLIISLIDLDTWS